jgi:hypothetical protein
VLRSRADARSTLAAAEQARGAVKQAAHLLLEDLAREFAPIGREDAARVERVCRELVQQLARALVRAALVHHLAVVVQRVDLLDANAKVLLRARPERQHGRLRGRYHDMHMCPLAACSAACIVFCEDVDDLQVRQQVCVYAYAAQQAHWHEGVIHWPAGWLAGS